MQRYDKIFFLHIPKTAGLTVHEILDRQYPNGRQEVVHTTDWSKKILLYSNAKKERLKVIKGHFLFGFQQQFGGNNACFTLLRNPMERTISGYKFILSYPEHPFHNELVSKKYSLIDFLEGKYVRNFDNIHVRFLCGDQSIAFGDINEEHLNQAKANLLSKNMFFGITEQFDESMIYLKNVLGWEMPFYRKINEATNKSLTSQNIDEATTNAIFKTNQFDIQLYEWACHQFKEKISAYGEGFKREVVALQEGNKFFTPKPATLTQKVKRILGMG